jgi:hypothetical protein
MMQKYRVGLSQRTSQKIKMLNKNAAVVSGITLCIFFYHAPLYAKNWQLIPSIQLQEIYSDNVNLASSGNKKSAFVTSLNPAVNIIWQVGKSNLNLHYNMQNLYNAHGDDDYSLNHQLQLNGHNIVSQNRFYVDSWASISQQNISNTRLVRDNISGNSGDTTTVNTVGIAPTWTPHFGNYASGIVRVNADTVTSGANSSTLSDTVDVSESVQLNSGSKFKRVSWSAGFNNSQNFRSVGQDISFQNSNLTLRTHIDKHFSVFATVGHSDNSFASNTQNSANGFFYTVGGRWSPSTHYWLEVGGGKNSYASVNISPMQRLSWLTTVRHNTIGLNIGTTWQTAFNYRTRNSSWTLSHDNETTTVQQMLLKPTSVAVDINSNPAVSDIRNIIIGIPTLTNEVLTTQNWNLSASYFTGRSTWRISGFNQDRTFEQRQVTEHVRGVNASWNWQFASKTNLYLSPQWQQIDRGSKHPDNRYDVAVGLNQMISKGLSGNVEFRHVTQASDLSSNEYEENRATANLFMRF